LLRSDLSGLRAGEWAVIDEAQEWNRPLAMIAEHCAIDAAYGVYLGKKTIVNDAVTVLPFAEFSRRLWAGDIF
jgi:hypothetical protein